MNVEDVSSEVVLFCGEDSEVVEEEDNEDCRDTDGDEIMEEEEIEEKEVVSELEEPIELLESVGTLVTLSEEVEIRAVEELSLEELVEFVLDVVFPEFVKVRPT